MDERTPERVVASFLDALGSHDLEAFRQVCADDIVELLPGSPPMEGIDDELAFAHALVAAFPDLEIEVTRLMSVDRVVAAEWIRRGTFTGADFQGLPANGARFESPAAGFFEIENGLVKRLTVYTDMNKLGRDLGVVPPEGSTAERLALGMFRTRVRIKRAVRTLTRREGWN
ncbi:MAG: beta-lactamase domain protein [Mycobacterium sp.]|jgi:steroid delta-isomerase-like uncharacterized protein|nr:beta-lactamase domain protein [Mycobacterium sp.]